jgi:hypothetical protein
MADIDVLVRPERADDARVALEAGGWTSKSARSPARIPLLWEDELHDAESRGLDLHWSVFASGAAEDDLWEHSVPVVLGGVRSRSLSAPDRLLHVCVHGLAPSPEPAVRWVIDALTIVARQDVDWDRFVAQARRHRVSLTMADAISYLRETFDAPVPDGVPESLARGPHSRLERVERELASGPMGLREWVRWHWCRYRRVEPRLARALVGYPGYLRLLLGYDRRRDFARRVVTRLSR